MVSIKRGGSWVKIPSGEKVVNVVNPSRGAIYIPIDEITRTPGRNGGPAIININKNAPVFQRGGGGGSVGGFTRTGTISNGGVRTATQTEIQNDPLEIQRKAVQEDISEFKKLIDARNRIIARGGQRARNLLADTNTKKKLKKLSNFLKGRIKLVEKGVLGSQERLEILRGERAGFLKERGKKKSKLQSQLATAGQSVAFVTGSAILGTIALAGLGKKIVVNIIPKSKQVLKAIIKDPKNVAKVSKDATIKAIKNTPDLVVKGGKVVGKAGKDFVVLFKVSPVEAIAKVGTDAILLLGSGGSLKIAGKLSKAGIRKANKVIPNIIKFPEVPTRLPIKTKGPKTFVIGSDDFQSAVNKAEDLAEELSDKRAKAFINRARKNGKTVSKDLEREFKLEVRKITKKRLESLPDYKKLKQGAKLNKPVEIRVRKIPPTKLLLRKINARIKKIPINKNLSSILSKPRKIRRKISVSRKRTKAKQEVGILKAKAKIAETRALRRAKMFRKGTLKRRIGKKIQKRKAIKEFKQTNKYRMLKARTVRKVNLVQLNKAQNVGDVGRFIDKFFDEMGKRQKIDITNVKYRQLKNVIKKRVTRAIKKGDKEELAKFRSSIKKLYSDMNKKSNAPTVKISQKVGGSKRFKTIKDFETEAPKGSYQEVRQGQQVVLQEMAPQIQKTKTVQRQAQRQVQRQVFKIESVVKSRLDLRPLLKWASLSIANVALARLSKTKQDFATTQKQDFATIVNQDSPQDFRTLQEVGSAITPKLDVAQIVKSAVRPKLLSRLKGIRGGKKKSLSPRLPQRAIQAKKGEGTPVFNVFIKKGRKLSKLNKSPIKLSDARNLMAYNLDNRLSRTGSIIPAGSSKKPSKISKKFMGTYSKRAKKFRIFKVRKGKKILLRFSWIEKTKYIVDTRGERRGLKIAQAKSKKRRVTKKKVAKRKRKR